MIKFQIELVDKVPIVRDGQNVILIDTGSPVTIHTQNSINFCETDYPCETNLAGTTVRKISEMLGAEITTLMGMDILSQYIIILDYSNKTVEFLKEDPNLNQEWNKVELYDFMGIKLLNLSIAGTNVRLFLDTGAKISYLPQALTNNLESINTLEDYHPTIGRFKTSCYVIHTELAGSVFSVTYGNLPYIFEQAIQLGGANGVIGFDLFMNFKVMIDSQNNLLRIIKH